MDIHVYGEHFSGYTMACWLTLYVSSSAITSPTFNIYHSPLLWSTLTATHSGWMVHFIRHPLHKRLAVDTLYCARLHWVLGTGESTNIFLRNVNEIIMVDVDVIMIMVRRGQEEVGYKRWSQRRKSALTERGKMGRREDEIADEGKKRKRKPSMLTVNKQYSLICILVSHLV